MRAVWGALVAVVVLGVATGCQPPAPKATESRQTGVRTLSQEETRRLLRYYARRANVPPDAAMRVSELRPTPVGGLWTGVLDTPGARVPFTMSGDARYVMFAPIEDVAADPYADVMQHIELAGVPVKGAPAARVTIVEYGDFQCPYSAQAFDTIENQVLPRYGSQVRFAFKHMPLSLHQWAEAAAVAAECMKLQSTAAYWKTYAGLFQSQAGISNSNLKDSVIGFVGDTGVDVAAFGDCFDQRRTLGAVHAQAEEAQRLGVQATPTFFVNGRRIAGAAPFEAFASVIDTELAWR